MSEAKTKVAVTFGYGSPVLREYLKTTEGQTMVHTDNTGCGSAGIAGINMLNYFLSSIPNQNQHSQAEIAQQWTDQFIHRQLGHLAIAIGHTNYKAVRDALLQVVGWKCGGEYYSNHAGRGKEKGTFNKTGPEKGTLYIMLYSPRWADKKDNLEPNGEYKEAPNVVVEAEAPPVTTKVVRRRAKTPLAKAVGTVKMVVVKTKRAVKKVTRKPKVAVS